MIFEVETLKYATLATVSRCGMVWFSEDVLPIECMINFYLKKLTWDNYDETTKMDDDESKQPT